MNIWLTFLLGLLTSTLFTAAGLVVLFMGHWPLALFLFGIDVAVYRFMTYRLEHGV